MSHKLQILNCAGPPAHEWDRPAQRGKPPRYCPKHDPRKNGNQDQDHAKNSQADSSPSKGATPDSISRPNPFIERARNPFIERAKRKQAEALKQEDKPAREVIEDTRTREERLFEESEQIDEMIARANAKYTEAFLAATHYPGNIDPHEEKREAAHLWDKADIAQNTLINMLNRKRYLDAELEKMTSPVLA
jgi:hypothetical protein